MNLTPLTAVSPIDGRYGSKTSSLREYFSEYALIKYRLHVEVEYFIALCEYPLPQLADVPHSKFDGLRKVVENFSMDDALAIKEIESRINHDVKAVEYFLKNKLQASGLGDYKEFVHFGLTSQDINNTAIPLSLKEGVYDVYLPALYDITERLNGLAETWKHISMLARTHGQPASPTRLGKEIKVFIERLDRQVHQFNELPHSAKFGGATGNFNAHKVAYPGIDWKAFGDHFVNVKLRLSRSQYTTQIEHYDNLAALFDCMKRINTILIDLSRDMWTYISMDYFKQQVNPDEVGSSAMPHKVNPIDFENAEGNLGVANALYEHLSAKLPVSRLQRDLTDSTVLRNIGVPVAHSLISFQSLLKGLNKLTVNEPKIAADLEDNWMVVAEAIQTILRREGVEKPYEKLKELTRGKARMDAAAIHLFVDGLDVNDDVKEELKAVTPANYTGIY